ncbi:MAG: AAA family ATPase [Arcobacteraceae bacterium]|jgi:ATP-dependent Clp protease ATP-binding subunit ClpA|nr:AAA family ATPase [Arcobacteraceae bacterium]
MANININKELQKVFTNAVNFARANKHEYLTSEHIFLYILKDGMISTILTNLGIDLGELETKLKNYIQINTPRFSETDVNQDPIETLGVSTMMEEVITHASLGGRNTITIEDIFVSILKNDKAYSTYLLKEQGLQKVDILEEISHGGSDEDEDEFDDFEDIDEIEEALEKGLKKEKEKTPLAENSTELVALALEGKIDPVIGREGEVARVIEILGRRKKNNPILLGETGVGKTAIVEALALKIASNEIPDDLKDAKIFALDMGSMVAGTKYRGDFEKKLKAVLKEVSKSNKSILFIDEIHQIIGAGSVGGSSMDASNILKPLLSSGKLKCIGATTYEEYRNDFTKDKAFSRRFAKVEVNEPNIEDSIKILEGLKSKYEEFHGVVYEDEALRLCVELSKKFITDRFLPDSAIDVLDEVAATKKYSVKKGKKPLKITSIDVEKTISKMANIPPKTATSSDLSLLEKLETNLKKRVFGQDDAIVKITKAIKINKAGLGNDNKPIGSFLFTGSTGVGKTEVAKELAKVLGVHFARFDMSEYGEAHTVSRLIGAPAGYVGHEKGGLLSEAIKKHPHSVLLLDEIEKAHPELLNILLQVMDNATITDNNGYKVDFQNVIIIMTSNLGAKSANVMGFTKDEHLNTDKAVKNFFAPEFRNRLDEIVKFAPLDMKIVLQVVGKFIGDLETSLNDKKVKITITKKAKEELARLGYDKEMGARPLIRVIRDKIKLPLSEEILFGKLKNGGDVKIDFKEEFLFLYELKQ